MQATDNQEMEQGTELRREEGLEEGLEEVLEKTLKEASQAEHKLIPMPDLVSHSQIQDLLDAWGNMRVDNVCIRELAASLQGKAHQSYISWLEEKVATSDTLTLKDMAVFALLHNQTLLLMHHDTNEAISIDIPHAMNNVLSLHEKNKKQQQYELEKFERELDALCIDKSTDR